MRAPRELFPGSISIVEKSMKKRTKKLALAKETVRNLDEGRLGKVLGASDGSDGIQCAGSYCLNCATVYSCPATSGTKYC
jgi:hypothetical protein